jgi:HTH-type transcriptional regulator/antitoxin HigA
MDNAMIKNEKQYNTACERIEELLKVVGNETSTDDKNFIELDLLSDLVADYEEAFYPVKEPVLADVIKLRMYEMGINQMKLSELLEIFSLNSSFFFSILNSSIFSSI